MHIVFIQLENKKVLHKFKSSRAAPWDFSPPLTVDNLCSVSMEEVKVAIHSVKSNSSVVPLVWFPWRFINGASSPSYELWLFFSLKSLLLSKSRHLWKSQLSFLSIKERDPKNLLTVSDRFLYSPNRQRFLKWCSSKNSVTSWMHYCARSNMDLEGTARHTRHFLFSLRMSGMPLTTGLAASAQCLSTWRKTFSSTNSFLNSIFHKQTLWITFFERDLSIWKMAATPQSPIWRRLRL